MLPKPNRLPSFEIKSVMRRGRSISSDWLQLIFRRREEREINFATTSPSRFAVIVPMSVDKRATARNRIRRLVRESVRLLLPKIASGWDGVFMMKKGAPDEFVVMDQETIAVFRKAGIVNPAPTGLRSEHSGWVRGKGI